MAIEQRAIRVGNSRQAYGTPARDVRMNIPKQSNWAGLANALGVAVGGVRENLEEEAKREAISKVNEIQVQTAGKSPKERQAEIDKARVELGSNRGFFEKLLVDEDEQVKAYDNASWAMRAVDTKRDAERLEADLRLQGKSFDEINSSLAQLYNDRLSEASQVSDSARESYLKGVAEHVDAMQQGLWRKEQERVEGEKIKGLSDYRNKMSYDVLTTGSKTSIDEFIQAKSVQEREVARQKVLDNLDTVSSQQLTINKDIVKKAKALGLSVRDAHRANAEQAFETAKMLNMPEYYEKVMSADTGGGKSYKKEYPEEYLANMQNLIVGEQTVKKELHDAHRREIKAKNTGSFAEGYSDRRQSIRDYDASPNGTTLTAIQDQTKLFREQFNDKKNKGDFRFDPDSMKAWENELGLMESFLNKKAYDPKTDLIAQQQIEDGTFSKSWWAVHGHRVSGSVGVTYLQNVDRTEKYGTASANEQARANVQVQSELSKAYFNSTKNEVEVLKGKIINPTDKDTLNLLTKTLEDAGRVYIAEEKLAEHTLVREGKKPAFDGRAVNERVRKRIDSEFGNTLRTIKSTVESEEPSNNTQVTVGSSKDSKTFSPDNFKTFVRENKLNRADATHALFGTMLQLDLNEESYDQWVEENLTGIIDDPYTRANFKTQYFEVKNK